MLRFTRPLVAGGHLPLLMPLSVRRRRAADLGYEQQHGRGGLYWMGTNIEPPVVEPKEILAEVVRAERWAERLLLRKWELVETVANALTASPENCLTGAEVRALVSERRGAA